MRPLNEQKVLLLQPFINFYGGAEYLLSVVAKDIFPHADIYTFSYKENILKEMGISKERIISPFGGGLVSSMYRQMTPLYPAIIDTLNVSDYDLVLSFSYGYVHGVVSSHMQPHLSYIQTPMRLLWLRESEHYWYDKVPVVRELYRTILSWQRLWDRQAAMRPDYLLANSQEVSNRVDSFWKRESSVIYPPVDTAFYKPRGEVKKEEYLITHSRLVRYKRIDILIEACRQQKRKLIIVGDGPDYFRLKVAAQGSPDIQFTGYVSHREKVELLQKARGFLYASHEDFGIAPVEALAAGTSVLAYGKGGVTETVTSETGMFYDAQTSASIESKISGFEKFADTVKLPTLLAQAEKFSKEKFIEKYRTTVEEKSREFFAKGPPCVGMA